MQITFWGTRGSLPVSWNNAQLIHRLETLNKLAKSTGILQTDDFLAFLKREKQLDPPTYGGNTTCTEITTPHCSFFVDMGSGLREAGTAAIKNGRHEFHIFMTHVHWDHIMGLPFFIPIYSEGHKIYIYHVHKLAPKHIKIEFNGVNFPVKWDGIRAEVKFIPLKIYEPYHLHSSTITPFVLDHPGGSFGYRIDHEGKSVAIGVDGEYKRVSRKDLGRDLAYYQNLDLLIFDGQYEIDELPARHDWGHSSPNVGVELALREGIKRVAFTHHDPWANEERLHRMLVTAKKFASKKLPQYKTVWTPDSGNTTGLDHHGPDLFMAYDGLNLTI